MIKKAWILAIFVLTACVTVNVYFPAAAVEKAAGKMRFAGDVTRFELLIEFRH